jgi:hypothetical protein
MPLLDFARHYEPLKKRQNLRLILWAGDGVHGDVSDVARLRGYDMYLCMGLTEEGVQRNLRDLSSDQTICLINIFNLDQMAEFHKHFDGAFSFINSDYYGNTPSLPLIDYERLLCPGGIARNIEGINGLRMPVEEMLDHLELAAPALPSELNEKRLWTSRILDLAKRDQLTPGAVWSSPDLKDPYYDNVRVEQERFMERQKMRSSVWPSRGATLEEHWEKLPVRTLTANLLRIPDEILKLLDMEAFDRFLATKIPERFHKSNNTFKQKILKLLSLDVPPSLVVEISEYKDDRRGGLEHGIILVKKLH